MASRIQTNKVHCKYHPDCSLVEDYHAGDMICSECGLVVGDRVIDVGSEWRTFSNDKNAKDASRVGGAENSLLGGSDLSTMIGTASGSAGLDDSGRPLYKNRRQMNSSDRALLNAFGEIKLMSDRLNLPAMILDRANTLFKQVQDTRSLKGRSNDAISAACLYMACRQESVPRTLKEICAVSNVSKKDIGRVFKLILIALETNVELITSEDFMSRFCSNLDLSGRTRKAATQIAKKAVEIDCVAGRSPISVAAAAIYMASHLTGEIKTQKEIGDIAGVAEMTIKQAYKQMIPKARRLITASSDFFQNLDRLPAT